MTTRRSFITAISAALAGVTLDTDRLLWVPGAKLISIAKPGIKLLTYYSLGGRFAMFSDGGLGRSSGSICGICLEPDVRAVRRHYPDVRFQLIPYEGNEDRYHQLNGVTRLHATA